MKDKDYYSILEVSPQATDKEIKKAYRRLARLYHPDLHPGDKFDEDMFKAVNEAYEVLSDPDKRWVYDRRQEELLRRETYNRRGQADAQINEIQNKGVAKYLDKLFGWSQEPAAGKIFRVIILLIIILPMLYIFSDIAISPLFAEGRDVRNIDCLRMNRYQFEKDVLASPIPVLVIFCDDPTWNKMGKGWNAPYPYPEILALKRTIQKGEYEGKIKFYRYYFFEMGDPVLEKYNDPRVLNDIAIFTNGKILYRIGGGSSVEEDMERLELILRQSINAM